MAPPSGSVPRHRDEFVWSDTVVGLRRDDVLLWSGGKSLDRRRLYDELAQYDLLVTFNGTTFDLREKGPQDLVILILIAEACNSGLNHQQAGYWGSAASVITILLLGWICERTTYIRQFLEGRPVFIYEHGTLDKTLMEKHMVDETDLELAAREYGLASYHDFSTIVLEGDGAVTGVVAPHALKMLKK